MKKRWYRKRSLLWLGGLGAVAGVWLWRRERAFDESYEHPDMTFSMAELAQSPAQVVVPAGTLTGRYGVARTATHVHRGIDIGAPEGSEILSPAAGVVVGTWPDCNRKGYGNNLLVQHADGVLTFYAHLQDFAVVAGQRVGPGTVLGWVGSTRCGINRKYMAPHLHMEVHTSKVGPAQRPTINETTPDRMDPLTYLERIWHGDAVV